MDSMIFAKEVVDVRPLRLYYFIHRKIKPMQKIPRNKLKELLTCNGYSINTTLKIQITLPPLFRLWLEVLYHL